MSPTTPPFDAEYAAWPIWPSNAATDAMLTMAPRWPSSVIGSVWAMAAAHSRIMLNVPIRLTLITNSNWSSGNGLLLRSTVRLALPRPALLTHTRSGPISDAAATAACPSSSLATLHFANRPPSS